MNPRELAVALSALTPTQVESLTTAAASMRDSEAALAQVTTKPRKKRGPNKPKAAVPVSATPAPARKGKGKAEKFGSMIDRVKAIPAPGLKVRKSRVEDED